MSTIGMLIALIYILKVIQAPVWVFVLIAVTVTLDICTGYLRQNNE